MAETLTRQQRRKAARRAGKQRGGTTRGSTTRATWVIDDPTDFMVPLARMAAEEGRPNPFAAFGMNPAAWENDALMHTIAQETSRQLGGARVAHARIPLSGPAAFVGTEQ